MTHAQQSGESRVRAGALGKVPALVLYAILLGLSYATLDDARLRLASVAVLLAFAGLTLFHGAKPAPPAWGRPADLASGDDAETNAPRDGVVPPM